MGIFLALLLLASLTFANAQSNRWQTVGGTWQLIDVKFVGKRLIGESSNGQGFAIALFSQYAQTQTVEVKMTPLKRVGSGWSAGGLCVFQDGSNFWRLALVEAPNGKTRYAELVAMSNSVWQAQQEWRLRIISVEGAQFAWQWNTPYSLRITLTHETIVGEVLSVDGKRLWCRVYALDAAPIVRSGWLALNLQGMQAAFSGAVQNLAKGKAVTVFSLKKAVVIRDVAMGNTKLSSWLATELKHQGLTVKSATFNDISNPKWWQKNDGGIFVLPNGRRLPAAAKEPFLDFLRQGGKLIVFGAPLFGEPMFQEKQRWMTATEIEEARKQTKPERWLFERMDKSEIKRWQHHTSHPDVSDRLSLEPLPFDLRSISDWRSNILRMEISLKGWSVFSRTFVESPFPKAHTLTCFWAKGASQTKSLMVEWRELDGTRWFAHVPLTTEWKLIVLSPKDFQFRADSPTRGKRGFASDRLNPKEARALVLGMEFPMPQGEHTIWVAGIGTAADPFGDLVTDFVTPTLEALSPVYKLYPMQNIAEVRDEGKGTKDTVKTTLPKDAVAPVPRWRGLGFTNGEQMMRWRPLFITHDAQGNERGALVWMLQCSSLPYPHASWLVFGSADEAFWMRHTELLRSALRRSVTLWENGVWLLKAGTDRFTAHVGERLAGVLAVVVNDTDQLRSVTLETTITDETGRVQWQDTTTASVSGLSREIKVQSLPDLKIGRYRLAVQLLLNGQVTDEISHDLFITERPRLTEADKVTVRDGHFFFQGKRWFAFGINYWPRYVAGQEQSDYWRHWLDPTNYDPEIVEQDLLILKEMGMNCVSVQFTNVRQALPLRDFLRRCHQHGIKVNLFIAGAHPLHFQPDFVRQLIEAADLANQPAMFAYDIAWEPHWGNYERRRQYNAQWQEWLEEQYGSVEEAEKDWGFKLPRDEKGNVTVPFDEHLLSDGEWRIMAAAYRRFLDDFISRRYREVVRFIRKLDPNHLIGARTGYGGGPFGAEGAFPFDYTAGAKHLDFVSPEGWNLGWLGQAEEAQFARAVFITAYARWASQSHYGAISQGNDLPQPSPTKSLAHTYQRGKPVFWSEFGLTLRHGAFSLDWYDDEERLKAQAKLYDGIYRLMQVSDADGAMAWWFPGGYRVDERSDFGIVNPDGTLRPAAQVAKRWSTILTQLPLKPTPATQSPVPITIDRDENARGAMALWLKHGDKVAELVQEGRRVVLVTDGTGKTSDDFIDVAIGNTIWQPGKPPKFLNGEINAVWVSVDGKEWREVRNGEVVPLGIGHSLLGIHLRLELGNTGEAAWLPPRECRDKTRGIVVRVQAEGGEVIEAHIPKRVEPFADVTIERVFVPLSKGDKPVTITVRLHWRNAPFGERWRFVVRSAKQ